MMGEYGKYAYNGYKIIAEGKSLIDGKPLPEWDDLPENIKVAWLGAALAVVGAYELYTGQVET